jgi:HD-GYP domain-containing protein (c-di-GMP phosphodiesterase class II)
MPVVVDGTSFGCVILLKSNGSFRENHLQVCRLNAGRLALTLKNRTYHEAVFSEYKETLRAIVATYESGSPYLSHHSLCVSRLAGEMAAALRLPAEEAEGIRFAGELHDVGMVGQGDEILLKRGRLTEQEYDLVKHHPMIGAALTAPIRLPIPIAPLILHHHERYDGLGYPAGLKGSEIPLGARILALGEVFVAMVTPRTYREALPFKEGVGRLPSLAGTQLDGEIVDLFTQTITAEKWLAILEKPETG